MSVFGRGALAWALAVYCGASLAGAQADSGLLTDLESSHVKITTGFTGQKVFVFGSTTRSGDIVVRVTSPAEAQSLSRKGRIGPFWLKRGKLLVENVPGLVFLLSNRPLNEIADRAVLERHGLTFHSTLAAARIGGGPADGFENWQAAFERLKQRQGLFRKLESTVRIEGGHLFSANFPLPAKLPVGRYRLDVYAFRHGVLAARQESILVVDEVGIERWVSRMALQHAAAFGVSFTLLAVALGLILSILLRRGRGRRL
jgi:uncharacterized protein (TIGR02186 family)